ncbi:MAG: Na+/H+ antiporter subunit E [Spirochaetota bacterium]
MGILFYALISFISYLVLTAGSGQILQLWSIEELCAGIGISIFLGLMCHKILPRPVSIQAFNPIRWILVILYLIGPFFLMLLVANIEVIYRVLSGKINPAIVRVETDLKSETGAYILSNSITLSPGTLTIELEPDTHVLYVHCLNWKKEKGEKAQPDDVSGVLHFFIKKIFG